MEKIDWKQMGAPLILLKYIKQTLKQLKLTQETIDLVRDLESDSLQDKSSHVCWVMTMRIHRKQEQKHNDSTTEMVV